MDFAEVILVVAVAYAFIGLVVGGAFVFVGVSRVDEAAGGGSVGFRLLIWPGAAALWPWVVRRWAVSRRGEGS